MIIYFACKDNSYFMIMLIGITYNTIGYNYNF
jgi:hypothetical protein